MIKLTEILGVPENLMDTSFSLFDKIIEQIYRLPNKSFDLEFNDSVSFNFEIYGNYKVGNQSFTTVNVELGIEKIDHKQITSPVVKRFYKKGSGKLSNDSKSVIAHNPDPNKIIVGLEFYVPENWKYNMNELVYVLKNTSNNDNKEPSIAHELMHAYNDFRNPKSNVGKMSEYTTVQAVRVGLGPLDELFTFMYYMSEIENSVRPSEIAAHMKMVNPKTNEEFTKFVQNNKIFNKLTIIKNLTYERLRLELHKQMPRINSILKTLVNDDNFEVEDKYILERSDDEKIDYILKLTYLKLSTEKGNALLSLMSSGFFEKMLGPDAFSPDKQKLFFKYINYYKRFDKNPLDFYKYEVKRLNQMADKIYRKISKLYAYGKE